MHGDGREAVVEILAIEPPSLGCLGDVASLFGVDATQRARPRSGFRLADRDVHAIVHKDRSGHEVELSLRLAPRRIFLVRLAVEFPEQLSRGWLKAVQPSVTA